MYLLKNAFTFKRLKEEDGNQHHVTLTSSPVYNNLSAQFLGQIRQHKNASIVKIEALFSNNSY